MSRGVLSFGVTSLTQQVESSQPSSGPFPLAVTGVLSQTEPPLGICFTLETFLHVSRQKTDALCRGPQAPGNVQFSSRDQAAGGQCRCPDPGGVRRVSTHPRH